jgi:hypothetical protein
MFGFSSSRLHAGEILKQISLCQIDDMVRFTLLDSQTYVQVNHIDHRVLARQDVSRCVDLLEWRVITTFNILACLFNWEVTRHILRAIEALQYTWAPHCSVS